MEEIGRVIFGTVIGFCTARITDYLNRRTKTQSIGMMLLRELSFHKQRVGLAMVLDQDNRGKYELKLPSPIWEKHASDFLLGLKSKKAEPIINWYASLTVLGNTITNNSGPDKNKLLEALENAHLTAQKISRYGKDKNILPLFSEIV